MSARSEEVIRWMALLRELRQSRSSRSVAEKFGGRLQVVAGSDHLGKLSLLRSSAGNAAPTGPHFQPLPARREGH